ncbi:threonine synthase [Humisphaera borealis]|uniref:Threonine synthase n=1 Tax=Humisphaera borealis TaxID=2807512 RepID=A0A7M2WRT1_9BACT|nr:threonine synthase [Humisphaera borealis]QOV88255.1 threonine synthase [Humisphaera borealis]
MTDRAFQQCINPSCAATYPVSEVHVACRACGALLDIKYNWDRLPVPKSLNYFEHRWNTKGTGTQGRVDFSGVWRFREMLPFFRTDDDIVTIGEGRTMLQQADLLARQLGMKPGTTLLQYEGLNPSGSFKDNGMTAAFTHAKMVGAKKVACASTGNTSASLAMFASLSEIQGVVFIGSGKIAFGKLSQALDYGALTLQITGDFDDCLRRVRQIAVDVPKLGIYLMNSVNPFRLEGQKSIMYRVLEARGWEPPDWVIVPGGNMGNCSAFGKAFAEMRELGLIKKVPRLAVINAAGANTLHRLYNEQGVRWNGGKYDTQKVGAHYTWMNEQNWQAHTVASAIEIGRPVNLPKALRALDVMDGVVREVSDEEILEARALVGRYGFGCEPASGASVAGLQKLLAEQVISPSDTVVCILTGHELKDPNVTVKYHTGIDMKSVQDLAPKVEPHGKLSNRPIPVADDLEAIVKAMGGDASMIQGIKVEAGKTSVPVGEY